MHLYPYKPQKPASFWCSKCDACAVDSEKPETGHFFVQFGHGYSAETGQYDGNYTAVMFALCPECEKE